MFHAHKFILFLIVLAAPLFSHGEFLPVRYDDAELSDSLVTGERDTVTYYVHATTDLLLLQLRPDSIAATGATDSLLCVYRNFISGADSILRGPASMDPVSFLREDGSTATLLNWNPRTVYTLLLDPLPGSFHQFIFKGNAGTIPYRLYMRKVNNQ